MEKGNQWRNKDYRYLNDLFDLSKLEGTLLDVGCALGDGLMYLQNKCHRIETFTGTDLSDAAIDRCKKNIKLEKINFFQHNILESIPEKFDNIICLQTIEHIENPHKAVKNLMDSTKRILIFGTPYRNRREDDNHLWSFDESDFTEFTDEFCIDKRSRNIYWIINKNYKNIGFRKTGLVKKLIRDILNINIK